MLSEERIKYITGSQAHRIMGGWEKELKSKDITPITIPKILCTNTDDLNADNFSNYLKSLDKQPLVRDCKENGFKVSGGDILNAWTYLESLKPPVPVFTTGMETYALEIAKPNFVTEVVRNNYKSDAMIHGNETEYLAVAELEKHLSFEFEYTNEEQEFYTAEHLGCTPDAVHYNDLFLVEIGGEVKCPNQDTHQFNLLNIKDENDLKEHYFDYFCQIQTGLIVTGAMKWYWASYNDTFKDEYKLIVIEVNEDTEFTELLQERAKRVIDRANEISAIISARYGK